MPLFDDIVRTETRPKRYNEPSFDYYNVSARPPMTVARALLEQWFARYPAEQRADLRARFRSNRHNNHAGAFFELYLHELFRSMGFTLQCHPELGEGVTTHPDFLVFRGEQPVFYLEGTITAEPEQETAANARLDQCYDALDALDSPNFFLGIEYAGAPLTPLRGAAMRREIRDWLESLNPDEVRRTFEQTGFQELPTRRFEHDGCVLVVSAIPKSAEHRGTDRDRPIGLMMPAAAQQVRPHESLRNAIERKGSRYGELGLPLVIAVNVLDDFFHEHDIMDALFGDECIVVSRLADGTFSHRPDRKANGAWRGPAGGRNRIVSAAIVVGHLMPMTLASSLPVLIHNPWAVNPLERGLWPLTQNLINPDTRALETVTGADFRSVLRIPNPWPVAE